MKIEIGDLSRPAIHALLHEHLQSMYELSPPESVHALDLEKLRKPGITFWSAWEGSLLLGCGALKELDHRHGEVESMRTPAALRRKSAGRAILAHIIKVASPWCCPPDRAKQWLDRSVTDTGKDMELLLPNPDDAITFCQVGPKVSNARKRGAVLAEAV
jgi:hypothetical protein